MIQKLDNTDLKIATKIRTVFQVSYAVEAKLLKANEFPPLKRTIDEFLESKNDFYGYLIDGVVGAVIEIINIGKSIHIQSLVVDPKFFRQGIAQSLISYLLDSFDSILYTVETGAENQPAVTFYKKNGFIEIEHYYAEFGIRKVRFERKITTTP